MAYCRAFVNLNIFISILSMLSRTSKKKWNEVRESIDKTEIKIFKSTKARQYAIK
jgi:hypothetical protein